MEVEELLQLFGLTRQEAQLYAHLHTNGQLTGYEAAKLTGISRSNAYGGLSNLVEKGAAYLIEGKPAKYEAVPGAEFCRNVVRRLQSAAEQVKSLLPMAEEQENAYLTIKGPGHIRDKIHSMLGGTRYRVYLSMHGEELEEFLPALRKLCESGKKVVVITDRALELAGATLYQAQIPPGVIRVICDSKIALTGGLDSSPGCSCLFSLKENLVSLLKDSIQNEIRLIELER